MSHKYHIACACIFAAAITSQERVSPAFELVWGLPLLLGKCYELGSIPADAQEFKESSTMYQFKGAV